MQRPVPRKALDREDLGTVVRDCQHQTGIRAPTLDQHAARAALPMVTAFLGTRQAEMLAQEVEQRCARIELERMLLIVGEQRHRRKLSHG